MRETRRKRLLYVVNVDWFFISHRLPIAEAAIAAGFEVHLACALTGGEATLNGRGIYLHEIPMRRSSASVWEAIQIVRSLHSLMRSLRPDIVHLVTIKPVLLGGIAARLARVKNIVSAISGLGYTFISTGLSSRIRRIVIGYFYRVAIRSKNAVVIFQNSSDADLIKNLANLGSDQVRLIRGSGVDLKQYFPETPPKNEMTFTFAARLLIDKGIREFVSASQLLKKKGVAARFIIAGAVDPENPASVSLREVDEWRAYPGIEVAGHCEDISAVFGRSHVVVLPSYREGMPKALLEAAACGRAIITTDTPGCRDAVIPEVTGLLVPAATVRPLANAMELLIGDPIRCAEMGRAGRMLAEEAFGIEKVVAAHMAIYRDILERKN